MKIRAIVPPLTGLAVGAAAGWACSRIGTPIPWMLGPLAVAFLRVAGANVSCAPGGRQVGQWIIGTALDCISRPRSCASRRMVAAALDRRACSR